MIFFFLVKSVYFQTIGAFPAIAFEMDEISGIIKKLNEKSSLKSWRSWFQGAEAVEDLDKTQTPNEANAQNADVEMRNENAEEGRQQHGQNAEKTAIEPEEAQEKLTEGNGLSQQNQDEQMEVDQVCWNFLLEFQRDRG